MTPVPESDAARPRVEFWSLPAAGGARFWQGVWRALTRKCPYCGSGDIFAGYLTLRDACPTCGVHFEREDGYFLGGYAINMVVAESVALALALVAILLTALRDMEVIWQILVAVGLATLLPILFFPYSRGLWMALDLALHPPGLHIERQLRGVIDRGNG